MMATIAKMAPGDLRKCVEDTIDERLTQVLGSFEKAEELDDNGPTWDEIRARVKRHRWTPPPGAKSSLDLLREGRDG